MSRLANLYRAVTNTVRDPFTAETTGLPEAGDTQALELAHSETIAITAGPVRKQLGQHTVRMLAYNGFIPGPTLRVRQGSELTIRFTNNADVETTVHWHGLRLDNAFDGVPERHHGMQAPIPVGGEFTYRLRFPDPGIYWYHPHVRQDYTQELGLYGNILVESTDPTYWSPANREVVLVLDDILLKGSKVAPLQPDRVNPHGHGPLRRRDAHQRTDRLRDGCPAWRGRPLLPDQHGERPTIQHPDPWSPNEAGRWRWRAHRARAVRVRNPDRAVRARGGRRALRPVRRSGDRAHQ